MKDKRIWIVIGCILVIGTGVTHYTKYYVNSQGAAMMAETTAGAEEAAEASSFAPALGQQDTVAGGTDAAMAAGRAASATPAERRMTGDAGPGNAAMGNAAAGNAVMGNPSAGNAAAGNTAAGSAAEGNTAAGNTAAGNAGAGNTASGDTGPGSAANGAAAYGAAPAAEAGAFSSAKAAPAMADASEGTMASDSAGAGAAVPETAEEENMPMSPLAGAKTREYKTNLIVDYRKRLEDLDTQIFKMREEETNSNVYSIKTSAETELKLWEGELNSIYNALMEMLSQEDAAKLASEQQEWLKNRDAKAAESTGRNSGSMEGISYAATLAGLTKDRAYELAGRYEEANGVFYEEEESSQTP
ncbi:MAG: DUF1311 domain-containing protein [Clostridia bacterium]|nr:DUF1311 domain-containing protein [Clostridia bacterium]